MYHVAAAVGLLPAGVRATNFKQLGPVPDPEDGDKTIQGVIGSTMSLESQQLTAFSTPEDQYTLPAMWERVQASAGFQRRCDEAAAFNASHSILARGVSCVPVCYSVRAGRASL